MNKILFINYHNIITTLLLLVLHAPVLKSRWGAPFQYRLCLLLPTKYLLSHLDAKGAFAETEI